MPSTITVETLVQAPVSKAWECWTNPEHITQWNNASADWHTPTATNDLRPGGEFHFEMAARDGSMSFDFNGVYDEVLTNEKIAYTMADGRKATVLFHATGDATRIVESFDAENMNPEEMQRAGWQAILDNFKHHTESQ
jgi:uncharacterized protein YndB with AHSA1/START domain